jgi:hypothetical protein
VDFIQLEAATHPFVDGVRDREVKRHLMGGERSLNETLNEALKLDVAKVVVGPPARLREVARPPTGTRPPRAEVRRNGRPVWWQCGNAGHLSRDCGELMT